MEREQAEEAIRELRRRFSKKNYKGIGSMRKRIAKVIIFANFVVGCSDLFGILGC